MKPILTGFILLFGMNIFHAQAFTPKRQPNLATEDIGFVETEGRPGFYVFTKDAKAIDLTGNSLLRLPSTLGNLTTLNKFLPTQLRSGYMLDIWADGPIGNPFNQLLCSATGSHPFLSGCNSVSFEPNKKPAHIDSKGFYGFSDVIRSTQDSVKPKIGQSYYYQLKNMPLGTALSQDLNYCVYQDRNNSNRCLAQPSDASVDWQVVNHTTHKTGHMTFHVQDL